MMNPYYKRLAQPVSIVLPRYGTGGGAGGFVSESQEKPEIRDVWLKEESNIKFIILDFNPTSNDFVAYSKETKKHKVDRCKKPYVK